MRRVPAGEGGTRIIAVTLACVACGPAYRTQTDYYPPADANGRASVSQCEVTRMQCEQLEDMKARECQRKADERYDACVAGQGKYCYRETCSVDAGRCKTQYDRCFVLAGGRLESNTVCVARCPESSQAAPPAPAPVPAAASSKRKR